MPAEALDERAHEPGFPPPVVSEVPWSVLQVGQWSAILVAILSLGWLIAMGVQNAVSPVPSEPAAAYARDFQPVHLLNLYPSILLPLPFITLLASLFLYASPERRIWALVALAIGIVYAVIASINYLIQLVSVQQSLLAGESAGLEMFVQSNPHGIFGALASAYVYNSLATLFAAFVLGGSRLERRVRGLFIAVGAAVPLQISYYLFGWMPPVLLGGLLWALALPAGCIVLAAHFRRAAARAR